MSDVDDVGQVPVMVELVVVLKSGACIGPVRIPWEEAEGVRGMIWPVEQPKGPPTAQPGHIIHISSGEGVEPPWLVAFDRREVAGISAIALVEEKAKPDAVAGD